MSAGKTNEASDILKGLNIAETRPLLKQMGHLRRFELLETPFCLHLSSCLSENKLATHDDNETPYNLEKKMLEKYFYISFLLFCLFNFAVNCLRCFAIATKSVTMEVEAFDNNTNATNIVVDVQFSHISWPSIGVYTHSIFANTISEHWTRLVFLRLIFLLIIWIISMNELLDISLEHSLPYTFYQRLKF